MCVRSSVRTAARSSRDVIRLRGTSLHLVEEGRRPLLGIRAQVPDSSPPPRRFATAPFGRIESEPPLAVRVSRDVIRLRGTSLHLIEEGRRPLLGIRAQVPDSSPPPRRFATAPLGRIESEPPLAVRVSSRLLKNGVLKQSASAKRCIARAHLKNGCATRMAADANSFT